MAPLEIALLHVSTDSTEHHAPLFIRTRMDNSYLGDLLPLCTVGTRATPANWANPSPDGALIRVERGEWHASSQGPSLARLGAFPVGSVARSR